MTLDYLDTPKEPVTKASKRLAKKAQKARKNPSVLTPKSSKQVDLMNSLDDYDVVMALGAAGSGKTYVAARHALQRLDAGEIERIVISRPAITNSRHRLGYQPGNGDQKMRPWMTPIMDAFKDGLTGATLDRYLRDKKIEILPFEFMRGRTIKDGVFLLDEAQNCTLEDLEMFLTRIGEDGQAIICGDQDQTDLGASSGLITVCEIAKEYHIDIGIVEFDENDVVRSKAASEWVKAFKAYRKSGRTL